MTPITIDNVLALPKLCSSYTRERLEQIFAGRTVMTSKEVLATDVNSHEVHSKEDRIWTLSQPGILDIETSLRICTILLDPLMSYVGDTQIGVRDDAISALATGNIQKALRASYFHADYVGGHTKEVKLAEKERQYQVFLSVIGGS
jgi:hypothetical protein